MLSDPDAHGHRGPPRSTGASTAAPVENPVDPQGLGRVQVSVPDVLGRGTMAWAMPALPYGGSGKGFFAIPPQGANVWVEFERGDPDYPIWTGCFWDLGTSPVDAPPIAHTKVVLKSEKLLIDVNELAPTPHVFKLEVDAGTGKAAIEVTPAGLKLSFGGSTIELTQAGVMINGTNLVVMK